MRGFAGAAAALLLLVLSGATYARARQARAASEAFAKEWEVELRRPEAAEAARRQPTADFAAGLLASTAVDDETGGVRWDGLSEAAKASWLRSLERRDALVAAARDLALAAAAARPAWPGHALLAAKLEFLAQRRAAARGEATDAARWLGPMRRAVKRAPSPDAWAFLSGAMLESQDRLGAPLRLALPEALAEAFRDPAMVARAFPAAARALGTAEAMALVPDEPRALRAVATERSEAGDLAAAAEAWRRHESAERGARAEELEALEERARMGDLDGVRRGCRLFAGRFRPADADTPEGRRQSARVLELWPADATGDWRRDPRAELVRFFLDGRAGAVQGEALAKAVSQLRDVPEAVRARAALHAGRRYDWERLLESSDATRTLEWTPFHVELALAEAEAGRPDAARAALARMAPAARTECGALLARREVLRAERAAGLNGGDDEAEIAAGLAAARGAAGAAREPAAGGAVTLCVDPEADAGKALEVRVRAERPAVVAWGWNGGRSAQGLVSGEAILVAPLDGLQGRAFFSVRVLSGEAPSFAEAREAPRGMGTAASSASSWRLQAVAASEAPQTAASVAGMAGSERLNSTKP